MNDINIIDSKSSQLCLVCGICCQGIFFYHDLKPDKFGISPEPLNPILPLTCRLFREKENRCLIHEDVSRPPLCQTFQCQILKRLLQDEITVEQAQTVIKNIKTLLSKILIQLPQHDTTRPAYVLIESTYDSLKLELDSGDQSHLELFMDIIWLRLQMSRHIIPI
jgi:hypothetical protein